MLDAMKTYENPVGEGKEEQPNKQVNNKNYTNGHLIFSPLVYLRPRILTKTAAHASSWAHAHKPHRWTGQPEADTPAEPGPGAAKAGEQDYLPPLRYTSPRLRRKLRGCGKLQLFLPFGNGFLQLG